MPKVNKTNVFSLFQDVTTTDKDIHVKACPYVEYWNSLPHTSKVRYGKKTYKEVSEFFNAYKRYQIGLTQKYILTDSYKKSLGIVATSGMRRSDIEIFKDMDTASLAFDPKYHPGNKAFLKGTSFFYTQYSKIHKYRSLFLEFTLQPPKLLDDAVKDKIEEDIPSTVKYVRDKLYKIFDDLGEPLDDSHQTQNKVLLVATSVSIMWEKIPSGISIIDRHFNSYERFINIWLIFVINNAWAGMPISALHTDKDMWRKFITVTSKELGYNLMTGGRL